MAVNLTAVGSPTFSAGKFGNALTSSAGNLLTNASSAGLQSTTGFTVEWWAKITDTGYNMAFAVGSEWWGITGGNPSSNQDGGGGQTGGANIADGSWHHVAYCYDGTNRRVFTDGALVSTAASSFSSASFSAAVYVGGYSPTQFPWIGQIDEMRISKTARYTAAFTPQTANFSADANTLALWHLEDGTDSNVASPALTSTTAPAITPTSGLAAGSVLTVTNGSWSATPDSYTRIWRRAGVTISNATATTYTLASADLGNAIDCQVTGVKSGYTSGTATSNAVNPAAAGATAPGAPTGLAATAGNASASLSWTAPSSNGGAGITDYLVEYQPSSGSWTTFADGTSTSTTATVTGLTNGTAYAFRVSAINSIGTGTASSTASATPAASANGTVLPNDSGIVYSPYNWNVTGASATTTCSGAYLRFAVKGTPTAITANFNLAGLSGSVGYALTVDGTIRTSGSLASANTSIAITIPSNGWPEHTVELTFYDIYGGSAKWVAPLDKFVTFTGLTLSPTSCTMATMRRRPLNLLCYGDSILEGYSAPANGYTDGRLGWGYGLGALLGAEVGVVGYSAQGFTKVAVGSVPALNTAYNAIQSGVSRSFTTPAEPDLILINMGTNDGGGDITAAATTVLNGLLAATTNSKIVVIQQWGGSLYKATLQSVIASSSAPSRITYIDTAGWFNSADANDGLHPWGYANTTDLSPRLAATVRPLLTGSGTGSTFTPKRFVNVGGVAKAIG